MEIFLPWISLPTWERTQVCVAMEECTGLFCPGGENTVFVLSSGRIHGVVLLRERVHRFVLPWRKEYKSLLSCRSAQACV